MRTSLSLALPLFLAMGACADPADAQRITDLETKAAALEADVTALKSGGATGGPTAAQEAEAGKLAEQARSLAKKLEWEAAKAKIAEAQKKYPGTRAVRGLARLEAEIAVVGVDAGDLEVESWFQGEASMADGEATLMVFWETWCPHCRREVPKVQATWEKYGDKGLNLVALTKLTKSSTAEKVDAFIEENNLTYPIAKEKDGSLSQRFGVRGIPAAAVVKDGKVVWRGHPNNLSDDTLETFLGL